MASAARKRTRSRSPRRLIAWLVALCAIGAVLWALRDFVSGERGNPPLDDIDPASRDRLEEVLREAQRETR